MATVPRGSVKHVVVIIQENHTTDNYLRSLAPWGANVATDWPIAANPPIHDTPHDRPAYFRWLKGDITGVHEQFDTAAVLPYYLYLAATGACLENHCSGFGTNSTPNHLLLVGGQSPTLRNPSRRQPPPLWDMPSVPGAAEDAGVSWRVYAASGHYPVGFYEQLHNSPNVVSSTQFLADVQAGHLPSLAYVYHNSPLDEHPPADVTKGMNTTWQAVDAVVKAGAWPDTVFMLTYDDWGGFDDHVATPAVEYTKDNVQLAFGPRVPLVMFGGRVRPGIDSRWCSHVSVAKTAIQLLGLPDLGVPRLDGDAGLADLVDATVANDPPPPFGTQIVLPSPPHPQPPVRPLPSPPVAQPVPVAEIVLRNGAKLPPPDDVALPTQPNPPTNS